MEIDALGWTVRGRENETRKISVIYPLVMVELKVNEHGSCDGHPDDGCRFFEMRRRMAETGT